MIASVNMIAVLCLWCSCTESAVMVCKNQTEITNSTSLQLPLTSYVNGESYDCSCSITSATGKSITLSIERLPSIGCFVVLYQNSTEHSHSCNSTHLNYTLESAEQVTMKPAECQNTSGQIVLLSSQNGDMNISCYRVHATDDDHKYSSPQSDESSAFDRKLHVRILGGSIGIAIWICSVIVLVLCVVKHKGGNSQSGSYRKRSSVSSIYGDYSSTRRTSSVTTITEQIEIIPKEESDSAFKDQNDSKRQEIESIPNEL